MFVVENVGFLFHIRLSQKLPQHCALSYRDKTIEGPGMLPLPAPFIAGGAEQPAGTRVEIRVS